MTGGEGALRDCDDAGAQARVEHASDQRHAAARDESPGPPLHPARGNQGADVWGQRAAHRTQRENTRTQRIGAPGTQAPPHHAGTGAADDRADRVEHRRPRVEARPADIVNDSGPLNNYAYYTYRVGHHTEADCRAEDAFMQVYRPLYEESYAYRNGGLFDLRPLHMFFDPAEWKGKKVPRLVKIVDPEVVTVLAAIKGRCIQIPRRPHRSWPRECAPT